MRKAYTEVFDPTHPDFDAEKMPSLAEWEDSIKRHGIPNWNLEDLLKQIIQEPLYFNNPSKIHLARYLGEHLHTTEKNKFISLGSGTGQIEYMCLTYLKEVEAASK